MAAHSFVVALAAVGFLTTRADGTLNKRQSITPLTQNQISAFKPFTYYASTAYCAPSATLTWSCGANCDANPGFVTTTSGGDGSVTQYCGRIHFSAALSESGYRSHSELGVPVLTDESLTLTTLDSTLFPGIDSSIEVHNGFAAAQARSAADVLAAVESTLSSYGANSVTIVGHSLGAALALLDSVYLPLHLPSSVMFKTIGYGMPRVGNQAFANYVDANLHLTHINNKEDPVPIIPGIFLGFVHPAGEVHIMDDNLWVSCPGQDNPSKECIVGDEPSLLNSDESDHDGPYDGVEMGC
ncbi:hypothetical protein EW146_g3109 [Bondarzewia mesenterica]|uniref:Fungal lipase-type domain-containing protein n=1 Tax=Bondarzewia mesenterica TaxID=1095465 RepID=A0A4S4M041_9AGAM|nr:hypothetical protein EW146_g3109 [Bondarzewia mesenterica]